MNRRIALFTLLGLGILAVYVWVNDPYLIIHNVSKANPMWVGLGVIFNSIALVLAALLWHLSMKIVGIKIPFIESLKSTMISIFGDMLIPTGSVTGEAMRLAYLHNKVNLNVDRALAGLAIHRISYVMLLALFSAVGMMYLPVHGGSSENIYVAILMIAVFAFSLALIFIDRVEKIIIKFVKAVNRSLGKPENIGQIENRIHRFVQEIKLGVSYVKKRKSILLLLLVVGTIQWVFAALMFYMVFVSLNNFEIGYIETLLIYPVYGTLTIFPVGIPASMGIVETGLTATYMALGVDKDTAVAATIITRGILVWYDSIVSGTVFFKSSKYVFGSAKKS